MDRSHLFLLCLIGILLCNYNIVEGFTSTSGGYDYLKPIPLPPPEIDNTLALKFMTLLNKNTNKYLLKPSDESKPIDITGTNKKYTLDEINYYLENNKFPYDSYITDYLNKNMTTISSQYSGQFNTPLNLEILQEIWSSRLIYGIFIQLKEMSLNPKPLSYEIFTGTKPPPVQSSILGLSEKSSQSSQGTQSKPLSDSTYQKLVSVCSDIK